MSGVCDSDVKLWCTPCHASGGEFGVGRPICSISDEKIVIDMGQVVRGDGLVGSGACFSLDTICERESNREEDR